MMVRKNVTFKISVSSDGAKDQNPKPLLFMPYFAFS